MKNVKMMLAIAFIAQTTLASAQTTVLSSNTGALDFSQPSTSIIVDFESELRQKIDAQIKQIQLDISTELQQSVKQLLRKEIN
jgi:hypothetical protein